MRRTRLTRCVLLIAQDDPRRATASSAIDWHTLSDAYVRS